MESRGRIRHAVWGGVLFLSQIFLSAATAADDGNARFRDIYRELVETNTSLSSGDCTLAAQRMAARLRSAGYPDSDLHIIVADGHPREGSLVALLPGRDPAAKAILLLAHLDVVEARREDWTRDPFTLVEEDGYYYGRGTADDKSLAAVWVDTMMRLKSENVRSRRTVKLALTCGEETAGAYNGAHDLALHQRALIDAEFALTEGGWGLQDEAGKRIALNINAGEKFPQNYTLEVTNPGGHAMRPVKDNAIVRLGQALARINAYDFPILNSPATLEYFRRMAPLTGGEMGAAMAAFARDPGDQAAIAVLERDPVDNAMLHTTCVVTQISGGHASNALPQRATANINCRIFPDHKVQAVRAKLQDIAADPAVSITVQPNARAPSPPPPLTRAVMGPIEKEAARLWPGVPVIPKLEIGATDAAYLTPAGIPTYGFTGMFFDPDGSRLHGLNERIRVRALMEGRDLLYALVKDYAH